MPSPILEKNLTLLRLAHGHLLKAVQQAGRRFQLQPVLTQAKQLNIRARNAQGQEVWFYPGANYPQSQAVQEARGMNFPAGGVTYLVGLGYGFELLEALSLAPASHRFVVLETHAEVLASCLNAYDMELILADERVRIHFDDAPLRRFELPDYSALFTQRTQILLGPSAWLDLPVYAALRDRIQATQAQARFNVTGVIRFAQAQLRNFLRGLPALAGAARIDLLAGALKRVPAICVAAGPSLEKNIHLLKQARERALLICADSVHDRLLREGVVPHLVATIDPQAITARKIKTPPRSDSALLFTPGAHPGVIARFDRRFLGLMNDDFNIAVAQWLGLAHSPQMSVASVSQFAFETVHRLGCSPLILVGQDLAVTEAASHVEGVEYFTPERRLASWATLETAGWREDETVNTHAMYVQMKEGFERFVAREKGTFINATEGGANIRGFQNVALQALLDDGRLPPLKQSPAARLNENFARNRGCFAQTAGRERGVKLAEELDGMRRLARRMTAAAQAPNPDLAKLRGTERTLTRDFPQATALGVALFTPLLFEKERRRIRELDATRPTDARQFFETYFGEIETVLNDVGGEARRMLDRSARQPQEADDAARARLAIELELYDEAQAALDRVEAADARHELEKEMRARPGFAEYERAIEERREPISPLAGDWMAAIGASAGDLLPEFTTTVMQNAKANDAPLCVYRKRLDELLAQWPQSVPAWLETVHVEIELGNADAAAAALERLLELRPKLAAAHAAAATLALLRRDPDAAAQSLQQGSALHPEDSALLLAAGRLLAHQRQTAQALPALRAYHQKRPDDHRGIEALTTLLAETEGPAACRPILEKYFDDAPERLLALPQLRQRAVKCCPVETLNGWLERLDHRRPFFSDFYGELAHKRAAHLLSDAALARDAGRFLAFCQQRMGADHAGALSRRALAPYCALAPSGRIRTPAHEHWRRANDFFPGRRPPLERWTTFALTPGGDFLTYNADRQMAERYRRDGELLNTYRRPDGDACQAIRFRYVPGRDELYSQEIGGRRLHVHRLNGERLRTIDCDCLSFEIDEARQLILFGDRRRQIIITDLEGKPSGDTLGEHGRAPGRFAIVGNLALDDEGRLFVCDPGNCRVQVFDSQMRLRHVQQYAPGVQPICVRLFPGGILVGRTAGPPPGAHLLMHYDRDFQLVSTLCPARAEGPATQCVNRLELCESYVAIGLFAKQPNGEIEYAVQTFEYVGES